MTEKNGEITNNYNYHYNYLITNLNNYKRYIGVRSCNCYPTKDIDYWGSCKILIEAIKREGIDWFRKDILAIWDNRELAVEYEIKLHDYFEVSQNPMFYNEAKQTSTGFGCPGYKHSEETIKYLKEINTGENNPWYNKKQSEESNRKRSETQKGMKWIHKGDKRKMVYPNELDWYLNNGWQLGSNIRYHGEESPRYNKRYVNKDDIRKMVNPDELDDYLNGGWSLGTNVHHESSNKNKICINKDNKDKYIEKSKLEKYLNNGWILGSHYKKDNKGSKNPNYGKKWMNKDEVNKSVYPEEIEDYLSSGWQLGMIQNHNKAK